MKNPLGRLAIVACALIALHATGTAFAQYVWTDEKGVKHYSDMPPPPSVPTNRILKQPNGKPPAAPAETADEPKAAPPPKPEMTVAEKNADFRKRKAEQEEKEKKAAEEARVAAEKAKNCERAREYQRALESGIRLTRTDKNGERAFLTDEQRAQELKDAQRAVQNCK